MKENKINKKKSVEKKSLMPLYKFFGKFIGVVALYYIIVMLSSDSLFDLYLNITAHISSFFLNLLGHETSVAGNIISSSSTVMMLSFGCEGTEPIVIFLAGMIAIPILFKQKWLTMLLGVVTLYVLNFIRIIALYFIQLHSPENFESFHTVIFPIVFIFLSLILLGLSIKWSSKK